jgi:hypothetical protein
VVAELPPCLSFSNTLLNINLQPSNNIPVAA